MVSRLNAVDGFMGGYQFVDNLQRQDRAEARQQQQIDANQAYRTRALDLQQQGIDQRAEQAKSSNEYQQAVLGFKSRAEARQLNDAKRARIDKQFRTYGRANQLPPLDLVQQAEALGMMTPLEVMKPERRRQMGMAKIPLAHLQSGQLERINEPESLAALTHVYAPEINRNLGEHPHFMGDPVVEKRIARVNAAKDGRITFDLEVITATGQRGIYPLTMDRSSDPNDPVEAYDAGQMMDDLIGRNILADWAASPEGLQELQAAYGALYPGEASTVNQLYDDGNSVSLVMDSGEIRPTPLRSNTNANRVKPDPEDFVSKWVQNGIANQMPGAEGNKTPTELAREGKAQYEALFGEQALPASSALFELPAAAIEQFKRQNPHLTPEQLQRALENYRPQRSGSTRPTAGAGNGGNAAQRLTQQPVNSPDPNQSTPIAKKHAVSGDSFPERLGNAVIPGDGGTAIKDYFVNFGPRVRYQAIIDKYKRRVNYLTPKQMQEYQDALIQMQRLNPNYPIPTAIQ